MIDWMIFIASVNVHSANMPNYYHATLDLQIRGWWLVWSRTRISFERLHLHLNSSTPQTPLIWSLLLLAEAISSTLCLFCAPPPLCWQQRGRAPQNGDRTRQRGEDSSESDSDSSVWATWTVELRRGECALLAVLRFYAQFDSCFVVSAVWKLYKLNLDAH